MFYGILIFIHIVVSIGLIGIVLIQAGRGGGLSESFSGAESIFGTKTNALLTRATSIFAVIFFITCLSLAFLSKQRSKSLLEGKKIPSQVQTTKPEEGPPATEQLPNTQAQSQPQEQPPSSTVPETSEKTAAQ